MYYSNLSQSWAKGGTGLRTDEETNNSKYYSDLSATIKDATTAIRDDAAALLQAATDRLTGLNIMINYSDGCLYYDINTGIRLSIDNTTGDLMYEIM